MDIEETRSSVQDRTLEFQNWIKNSCSLPRATIQALPFDASFRRYYRVVSETKRYIAMDAPPTYGSCETFVAIAKLLRTQQLEAPEIFYHDLKQGFLLLSDFGDETFLSILNQKNVHQLYHLALDKLFIMKDCHRVNRIALPHFNTQFMEQEWFWHKEWFLTKFLSSNPPTKLDETNKLLIDTINLQPKVFMHRDYHSANLMFFDNKLGILDFQDAFIGPITYDCVSLLRDCYINWSYEDVERWLSYYFDLLKSQSEYQQLTLTTFLRWFDWMAIQRHMKALMTFARKYIRDKDPRYLKHMPRTMNYIIAESKIYPELKTIHDFYHGLYEMTCEKVAKLCVL